jgi:hypothetical protein
MPEETYLGDGLYASFDGYQFRLRAPRSGGDHEVYMEPPVLLAFQEYVDQIIRRHRATG